MKTVWLAAVAVMIAAGLAQAAPPETWPGDVEQTIKNDVTITRLWLPAGVKTVRGIMMDASGSSIGVAGPTGRALARNLEMAQLGVVFTREGFNMRGTKTRMAAEAALKEWAKATEHPELAYAPLYYYGASRGGGWSNEAAFQIPDRSIAYTAVVGGVQNTKSEKVLGIPAQFIVGSVHDPFNNDIAVKEQIPLGRARHALWSGAFMWGYAHHYGNSNALVLPFMAFMLEARVPKDADLTKGPAVLKALKEEDGWLGDPGTWESNFATIASFADYQGDKGRAHWFPNKYMACAWRSFVSKDPPVAITAQTADGAVKLRPVPDLTDLSKLKDREADRSMVIDPGVAVVLEATLKPGEVKVRKMSFYDGDQLIGEGIGTAAGVWRGPWEKIAAGPHVVYAAWTTEEGKAGVSNPGLIVVRKDKAPAMPATGAAAR